MNRDKMTLQLRRCIGHYNFVKLQSWIKYRLNFRKFYNANSKQIPPHTIYRKTVVYMADGRTSHGGFSDRLRGIISLYEYCMKHDLDFRIHFVHPFSLEAFLVPNRYDWRIDEKELIYDKRRVKFRFINSYSCMTEKLFERFLKTGNNITQVHVYSNWTNHEEKYCDYFRVLFKFSPLLEEKFNMYKNDIGCKYISVSFRFISLLGDFKDSYFASELPTEEEKEMYIEKSLECIRRLHELYSQYEKILVTTDSSIFLKRLEQLPYVYIIKGEVIHMDYVHEHLEGHLKTMIDYFMISNAEKVFCYSYGKMFKATRFAKTAALIGGKECKMIQEA